MRSSLCHYRLRNEDVYPSVILVILTWPPRLARLVTNLIRPFSSVKPLASKSLLNGSTYSAVWFRCNVISSLTNRGILRFRVFEERFTSEVFINFLRRLIQSRDRRVYLIVDRHPVHLSEVVAEWVERHQDWIRLIHLPAYGPELNPGEYLNQEVKTNAVGG
jgi:hypothetical protein